MLLAVIQEHRDAHARDQLTHALFNLVKRPSAQQRELILNSCVDLATRIGPARTAEELLPQCWEQVGQQCATCLLRLVHLGLSVNNVHALFSVAWAQLSLSIITATVAWLPA